MELKNSAELSQVIRSNPWIIDVLREGDETVLCVDTADGRVKALPFRTLHSNDPEFWRKTNVRWAYFIERNLLEKLVHASSSRAGQDTAGKTPVVRHEDFGNEYEIIARLSVDERVTRIRKARERLSTFVSAPKLRYNETALAIAETAAEAALANRATLLESMGLNDPEAKQYNSEIVEATTDMMKVTTRLITSDLFNDEHIRTIICKSNGTVLQHIKRVFLDGMCFLAYYNHLVTMTSITQKLQMRFNSVYRPYYRKLLPHLDEKEIRLQRVFLNGIQPVDTQEILDWSIGFLLHDIGKAEDIEYHEGEAGYDREKVVGHVNIGYTAIMKKSSYPREAGFITGYHHEYYGDPDGYGYFRPSLAEYMKRNPNRKQDYCMSYEMEPLHDFRVLAYFPAKVLEVVDVFDGLTDPNRKYKPSYQPENALEIMRTQFVENRLKLDPILLDLFIDYWHSARH